MATGSPTDAGATPASSLPYLLSLVLPLSTTAFFVAASHRWLAVLVWLGALGGVAALDELAPPLRRVPPPASAVLPRLLTFALAALQIANFALLIARVAQWGPSARSGVGVLLVGVGSAFSSMIVSHELIHR